MPAQRLFGAANPRNDSNKKSPIENNEQRKPIRRTRKRAPTSADDTTTTITAASATSSSTKSKSKSKVKAKTKEKAKTTKAKTKLPKKESSVDKKVSVSRKPTPVAVSLSNLTGIESAMIDRVWLPRTPAEYPNHWIVGEVTELIDASSIRVEVSAVHIDDYDVEHGKTIKRSSNTVQERVVRLSDTRAYTEDHSQDWDDLLQMGDLHDASLLALFRRRFKANKCLTYAGPVLISVNPFKNVDRGDREVKQGEPHLIDVTRDLLKRMAVTGPKGSSQSVLVNGESGAGKTVACNSIVKLLVAESAKTKARLKSEASSAVSGMLKGMGVQGGANNGIFGGRGRGRGRGGRAQGAGRGGRQEKVAVGVEEHEGSKSGNSDAWSLEDVILHSNPLLEAFGNAQTIRNDNSSRFGKMVQLFYDAKAGPIATASTLHFLLEKSRVVSHARGERNYHCFYQLLAAASDPDACSRIGDTALKTLNHKFNPNDYRILSSTKVDVAHVKFSSKSNSRRTISTSDDILSDDEEDEYIQEEEEDDEDEDEDSEDSEGSERKTMSTKRLWALRRESDLEAFNETCEALEALQITPYEQEQLWATLAALLSLSNVRFKKIPPDEDKSQAHTGTDGCRISKRSKLAFNAVANAFEVDPTVLESRLCTRELVVGNTGNSTSVPLTPTAARESRDGFVMAVYASVFDWLVKRVNKAAGKFANYQSAVGAPKTRLFVGILDIFGFEVLENNSFEQICITYANLEMQQLFDATVFSWEQAEYALQGVAASHLLTYEDNQEVLDVYSHPTKGVFSLLDGLCMVGDRRNADRSMINKMAQLYPHNTPPATPRGSGHSLASIMTKGSSSSGERTRQIVKVMQHAGIFQVRHQIADVKYNVSGLVQKNIDAVQHDMISLFTADGPSNNAFMQDVLNDEDGGGGNEIDPADVSRARRQSTNVASMVADQNNSRSLAVARVKKEQALPSSSGRRQMARLRTVAQRFRGEINKLKKVLKPTQLRFVRCVKPNGSKLPDLWEPALVLRQLRFLGVMNLVRIRNQGFPTRRTFAQMLAAYPELVADANVVWMQGKNDRGACKQLLKHASAIGAVSEIAVGTNSKKNITSVTDVYVNVNVNDDEEEEEDAQTDGEEQVKQSIKSGKTAAQIEEEEEDDEEVGTEWRLGTSKCFLKRHVLDAMDAAVREKRIKGAARQAYLERRRRARAMMEAQRRAVTKLAPFLRMVPKRAQYLRRGKAAIRIQALARAYTIRSRFAELRAASNVIARFAHRFLLMLAVKEYVNVQRVYSQVSAAVKVQSFVRMALVYLQVERAKYFLSRVQCIWRGFVVRRRYMELIVEREPWKDFLGPSEAVAYSSSVVKTSKRTRGFVQVVSAKRRHLIITTGPRPRLFYVSAGEVPRLKGEIVWHASRTQCAVISETDFVVRSIPSLEKGKMIWRFRDLENDPLCWMRVIRDPPCVMDLVGRDWSSSDSSDREGLPVSQTISSGTSGSIAARDREWGLGGDDDASYMDDTSSFGGSTIHDNASQYSSFSNLGSEANKPSDTWSVYSGASSTLLTYSQQMQAAHGGGRGGKSNRRPERQKRSSTFSQTSTGSRGYTEHNNRQNMMLKDGLVMVLEYGTKRTWKRRWLVLQGIELRFYAAEDVDSSGVQGMDPSLRPTPAMAISIDHTLSVRAMDVKSRNRDISRTFELTSPLYTCGLRVRCLESNERAEWLDMIKLVIQSELTVASKHGGSSSHSKSKKMLGSGANEVLRKYDTMISDKNAEIERLQQQLLKVRMVGAQSVSGGQSVSGMSVASSVGREVHRKEVGVKSTKRRLKRTNSAVSLGSAASVLSSMSRRLSIDRLNSKQRNRNRKARSVVYEEEGEEEVQTEGNHQQQQMYMKPAKPQPKQRLFMA